MDSTRRAASADHGQGYLVPLPADERDAGVAFAPAECIADRFRRPIHDQETMPGLAYDDRVTEADAGWAEQSPASPPGATPASPPRTMASATAEVLPTLDGTKALSPGDLRISELMVDPAQLPDREGEWLELLNTRGAAVRLDDCELGRADGPWWPLAPVALAGHSYFTIARGRDPGFEPDQIVPTMSLRNTGDTLVLRCSGLDIDRLKYGGGTDTVPPGAALVRDAAAMARGMAMTTTAAAPDAGLEDGDAWSSLCTAKSPFGQGDLGTPGRTNDPCPP